MKMISQAVLVQFCGPTHEGSPPTRDPAIFWSLIILSVSMHFRQTADLIELRFGGATHYERPQPDS